MTPRFSLTAREIKGISKNYATYPTGEEIPGGSLVLVGYTMGCYKKDGEWVLTPNLNWVVVIAADD